MLQTLSYAAEVLFAVGVEAEEIGTTTELAVCCPRSEKTSVLEAALMNEIGRGRFEMIETANATSILAVEVTNSGGSAKIVNEMIGSEESHLLSVQTPGTPLVECQLL